MSLIETSATELLRQLTAGEVSSVDVTSAFLAQIDQLEDKIKAFVSVDRDRALEQAESVDQRRAAGRPIGLLGGLPVALKDILCTKDWATTCGSRMLRDFKPPYDATVVSKLKNADAVIIGKTNMDEFAMGSSTETSFFATTRNPWDSARTPGGSSGGSAACLAASMAPLSIGTDTGGSIRQPAAFCNVVGMKPSYGRVSRYGLIAFASSLDQAGPLARSAQDTALLLEAISGHDPLDSTSANVPKPDYRGNVTTPLEDLRIGVIKEHFGEGLAADVEEAAKEAIRVFESLGATVKEISLPHTKYAIATYYIIAPCEASSNLSRYDGAHYGYRANEQELLAELQRERKELKAAGNIVAVDALDSSLVRMYRRSRAEGLGAEVKRRIMLGTYALSAGYYDAYYLKALKVRRLIRDDFDAAFREADIILGPTTPKPAFRIGEMIDDPLEMYLQDLYTVSTNLCGITAISIPCGLTSAGLPIGLQLQAPAFEEERLLRGANMFQNETDWHSRRPNIDSA